jgi:hypothetical protein
MSEELAGVTSSDPAANDALTRSRQRRRNAGYARQSA